MQAWVQVQVRAGPGGLQGGFDAGTVNSEQEAPAGLRTPSSAAVCVCRASSVPPLPQRPPLPRLSGPSAAGHRGYRLGLCRPNSRLLSAVLTSAAPVKQAGARLLWRLWAQRLSQECNPLPSVPREPPNAGKTGEPFPWEERHERPGPPRPRPGSVGHRLDGLGGRRQTPRGGGSEGSARMESIERNTPSKRTAEKAGSWAGN